MSWEKNPVIIVSIQNSGFLILISDFWVSNFAFFALYEMHVASLAKKPKDVYTLSPTRTCLGWSNFFHVCNNFLPTRLSFL